MKIKLKFYARYGEKFGKEQIIVIENSMTVENFLNLLYERFPSLKDEKNLIIAINDSMAPPDYVLRDGDSVSIFPPPGGG